MINEHSNNGLKAAYEARRVRKAAKHGEAGLAELLEVSKADVPVRDLIMLIPGYNVARTAKLLDRADVSEYRLVGRLTSRQKQYLLDEC